MRIPKVIVGWLCVLSVVIAAYAIGFWLWLTIEPWLGGAQLSLLPPPNSAEFAQSLGRTGLQGIDVDAALKEYATQKAQPTAVLTGWEALSWMLQNGLPASSSATNVAAVALLDENTRIVAAYPRQMIGQVTESRHPIGEMEDSPTLGRYPYYRWMFARLAKGYAPDVGNVYMNRVTTPDRRTIALLVTASKQPLAAMPPGWEWNSKPQHEANHTLLVALVSLFAYWLLLPAWIALDACWRGMRPFAWGILVLVTNLIGLGGYLIARLPAPSNCPNCGEQVLGKYRRCPGCGVSLVCPVCHTSMKPGWQYCPVCSGVPPDLAEAPVQPPAHESLSEPAMIQASVIDAESGAPIPNAQVSIQGPSILDGLTSARGMFEARRLRGGTYTVTATKHGYGPAEVETGINEQAPATVQLELSALPGKISGRVIDRGSQEPVAEARVYLDSGRVDSETLTDSEGGFMLADIPAGPYTVRAEAEGFAAQSKLVELSLGQQATVDFSLEPSPDNSEAKLSEPKETGNDTK